MSPGSTSTLKPTNVAVCYDQEHGTSGGALKQAGLESADDTPAACSQWHRAVGGKRLQRPWLSSGGPP